VKIAALCVALAAGIARAGDSAGTFAPEYTLPAAGTYELPPIQTVVDHALLDEAGGETTLFDVVRGRIAIVAFVYTTCAESTGCPLSTAVLHRIDRSLADDPDLRDRVALISVSFDPERDTPARMRMVREGFTPKTDWAFLTAADEAALRPVLDDFGQPVAKLRYENGEWTGLFRHVLKVFLLDEHDQVRNIYSTGMISPDLVMNDLRTLAMERDATP